MDTIEKIRIVRVSDFKDEYIDQFNNLRDKGTEWNLEQGNKYLQNEDNALFFAFVQNDIVGFLTGHRLQRLDKRKAEVLLYEISVDENFRQRGVGKALVEEVKHWAKEVEADEVWVLTNKSNSAAVALYQSVGGVTENTDEQMYVFKL